MMPPPHVVHSARCSEGTSRCPSWWSHDLLPDAGLAEPLSYMCSESSLTKTVLSLHSHGDTWSLNMFHYLDILLLLLQLLLEMLTPDGVIWRVPAHLAWRLVALCGRIPEPGVPVHGGVSRVGDVEASIGCMRRRRRRIWKSWSVSTVQVWCATNLVITAVH